MIYLYRFISIYSSCLPPSEENWSFLQNKTRFYLQPGAAERRSLIPDGHTRHAQRYRFFTRPAVRAVEDSSQWGFKAYNSLFWISYGFSLKFPLVGKTITRRIAIPFTLPPTNLLISLHTCSTTRCKMN